MVGLTRVYTRGFQNYGWVMTRKCEGRSSSKKILRMHKDAYFRVREKFSRAFSEAHYRNSKYSSIRLKFSLILRT